MLRPGRDLTVGDAVEFAGRFHLLTRFEPYTGALLPLLGEGTRIAWSDPDWSITVPPAQLFQVLPAKAAAAAHYAEQARLAAADTSDAL